MWLEFVQAKQRETEILKNLVRSTLRIVSALSLYIYIYIYIYIVNNFGETLQWMFIGIVSLYNEPLQIMNKMLLQIVFTIWRVDCILKFFQCSSLLIVFPKKKNYSATYTEGKGNALFR